MGTGGGRGRRRQGKRRKEGSEEMGIIKKLLSVCTKWSGIHFEMLILLMHTHTHFQCPSSHTTTPCLQGLPNVPEAKGGGGRRDACQGAAATVQLCQR